MQRSLRLFALGAVVIGLAPACLGGSPKRVTEGHFYENFKTVVSSAEQDGYTPYWLGQGFQAGGLEFRGPFADDIGAALAGGGVSSTYGASLSPAKDKGLVTLDLIAYSRSAWNEAKRTQDGSATKFARISGQDAKLFVVRGSGDRPIEQNRLLLEFGETTILAIAPAGGPTTADGPDVNPLIDEATFLAVMQNLRPYPQ